MTSGGKESGMKGPVYLDNAATTPIREEALEAMMDAYAGVFGNSSSVHAVGQAARKALEDAREEFADCMGADAEEIVFTSGGTESDNLAIRGRAMAARGKGDHIITCLTEHHAVLHCCRALEDEGFRVTYLPVDSRGIIDLDQLRGALDERTVLVSIMLANNETGALQPLEEISGIARERGVTVHCDAVQAVGKVPLDVNHLGVDLLSISGHKFHGPKGVGALYIRKGVEVAPLLHGGRHERGLRPGTVNVPGIVGMTRALSLAVRELEETAAYLRELRDMLEAGITRNIEGVYRNGDADHSLPNVLNMSFEDADGESLLLNLDLMGVAVSTGSACTSGSTEPSHVLMAMGVPPRLAQCSLRFSLGRANRRKEIEYVVDILPGIVERIREVARADPRAEMQA